MRTTKTTAQPKIITFAIILVLFWCQITLFAQTTINLAERCDCEVISSESEITDGATTPEGGSKGNLLVDASGDLFYWDGAKWASIKTLNSSSSSNDGMPVGSMISYVSASAPDGWLACDGSAVSRAIYADLFAIIGTTYGACYGGSTFNLPDTRGVFLRGAGFSGFGAYSANLGEFQADSYKSHNHSVDPPSTVSTTTGNHRHVADPPNTNTSTNGNHTHQATGRQVPNFQYLNGSFIAYDGNGSTTTSAAGNHNHSVNIPAFNTGFAGNHNHAINIPAFSSAASGGSETRPANIAVQYIIKY